MVADRADLGSRGPDVQVTAVEALPDLHALTLEDLALFDALGEPVVALLMTCLETVLGVGARPVGRFGGVASIGHASPLAGRERVKHIGTSRRGTRLALLVRARHVDGPTGCGNLPHAHHQARGHEPIAYHSRLHVLRIDLLTRMRNFMGLG